MPAMQGLGRLLNLYRCCGRRVRWRRRSQSRCGSTTATRLGETREEVLTPCTLIQWHIGLSI